MAEKKTFAQRMEEGRAIIMADPEKRKRYLEAMESIKGKTSPLIGEAIFDWMPTGSEKTNSSQEKEL